jgi:hypothetical protein
MRTKGIINLLELAAETNMPSGWLKEKAAEGTIPCIRITETVYKFHRRAAVRAVERIVAKGGGDGK